MKRAELTLIANQATFDSNRMSARLLIFYLFIMRGVCRKGTRLLHWVGGSGITSDIPLIHEVEEGASYNMQCSRDLAE
jgi:hypothetical protein